MNKLYKFFSVVFLGIFSLGTYANDEIKDLKNFLRDNAYKELKTCEKFGRQAEELTGVAEFFYEEESSPFCCGALISSYIINTLASCFDDHNYKKVKAKYKYITENEVKTAFVSVESLTDLRAWYNDPNHDGAFISVYGNVEWCVNGFYTHYQASQFPDRPKLAKKYKYDATTNNYTLFTTDAKTLDLNKCNENKYNNYTFCVDLPDKKDPYYQIDVGAPIYFLDDDSNKALVGYYSGIDLNKTTPGHYFYNFREMIP